MSIEDFNAIIGEMFLTEKGYYSITGDVLTMRKEGETESLTCTRK